MQPATTETEAFPLHAFVRFSPLVAYWGLAALVAACVAGLMVGLEWGKLHIGMADDGLLSVKLAPAMCSIYLLGAVLYLAWGVRRVAWLAGVARGFTFFAAAGMAGFLPVISWESYQVLQQGHWGISNLYEVSILLLAVVGLVGIWFEKRSGAPALGLCLAPLFIGGISFLLWLHSIGEAGPRILVPALESYWLPIHVTANFIGYGCFAVAGAGGLMQLWRARHDRLGKKSWLPAQDVAENISARSITIGFPVFTTAIVLGSAWAYSAWGGYWSWDPKETWAFIVWLVYGAYLHARIGRRWHGPRLAWWAVLGFAVTLFCYLGVNMFLGGLHSYGSLQAMQ